LRSAGGQRRGAYWRLPSAGISIVAQGRPEGSDRSKNQNPPGGNAMCRSPGAGFQRERGLRPDRTLETKNSSRRTVVRRRFLLNKFPRRITI